MSAFFSSSLSQSRLFWYKLLVLGLCLFFVRCGWVAAYGADVPFFDQWMQVKEDFLPWVQGSYSFEQFVAPHNGHRHALKRAAHLGLFVLNEQQWDPLLEMVFNAFLFALTIGLLTGVVYCVLPAEVRGEGNILLLGMGILWALPFGWLNIVWGFQAAWYFMILLTVVTLWGLLFFRPSQVFWWVGLVAGGLVYFTQSSGFLVLVAVGGVAGYHAWRYADGRVAYGVTVIFCFLMSCLAVLWWTSTPALDYLNAQGVGEFAIALGHNLSFPWTQEMWVSLLLFLPFLVYVGLRLRSGARFEAVDWLLLGLGLWVLLQAVALAYGRARLGTVINSRYLEIFAFGLVVNGLALVVCWRRLVWRVGVWLYGWAWVALVLVGLVQQVFTIALPGLLQHAQLMAEERAQLKRMLLTGEGDFYLRSTMGVMPEVSGTLIPKLLAQADVQRLMPSSVNLSPLVRVGAANDVFILNGLPSAVMRSPHEPYLGSFTALGVAQVGEWLSDPLVVGQSFVDVPVHSGGGSSAGLGLLVWTQGDSLPQMLLPADLPAGWVVLRIGITPDVPFRLHLVDNSASNWLAIGMPQQVGYFSAWLQVLLPYSFILGLLMGGILTVLMCLNLPFFVKNQDSH